MAKSAGSEAKSSSRLCFTLVRVRTPRVPKTQLPVKFAAAEKHTFGLLGTFSLVGTNVFEFSPGRGRRSGVVLRGRRLRLYTNRDLPNQELFEECTNCTGGSIEERITDCESSSISIGRRVVDVRDPCGGEVPKHIGVVRLPMAVVAAADKYTCNGIEGSGANAPHTFVEITRILMEDRRKDSAADQHAGESIAVGGAEAFGIA